MPEGTLVSTLQRFNVSTLYGEAHGKGAHSVDVSRGDHLDEYLSPRPLDLGHGAAVSVDIDLGCRRSRDQRERGRQDAPAGQAGRLVGQTKQLATNDLPWLSSVDDSLDENRPLRVYKTIVKQLNEDREWFTLQCVLAGDQTHDGVRFTQVDQVGDIIPGGTRWRQHDDISVAVGTDAILPRHLGGAFHAFQHTLAYRAGLLAAVDHVTQHFLIVEVGDVSQRQLLQPVLLPSDLVLELVGLPQDGVQPEERDPRLTGNQEDHNQRDDSDEHPRDHRHDLGGGPGAQLEQGEPPAADVAADGVAHQGNRAAHHYQNWDEEYA